MGTTTHRADTSAPGRPVRGGPRHRDRQHPFTLFPVARRHSEGLAVGYVGLRTLEAAVITGGIVSLLALVTLRRHPPQEADSASLLVTGKALVAENDWTFLQALAARIHRDAAAQPTRGHGT
ncbi:DUF4386 domain-containing protein [Streptomyces kaniharaensis]|uniref:DUF4386 domain-containing protein n=1 Tax=Streptomyces kaniharaensis TaxID=212423 RepID=UPI002DDCD91B|nr:DUF4386 domain-containing protein [Streptomyces kaniharaensis]